MPLYEFVCEVCSSVVEELCKSSNDSAPICHEKEMKKLISATKTRRGAGLYSHDADVKKMGDYND